MELVNFTMRLENAALENIIYLIQCYISVISVLL